MIVNIVSVHEHAQPRRARARNRALLELRFIAFRAHCARTASVCRSDWTCLVFSLVCVLGWALNFYSSAVSDVCNEYCYKSSQL